MHARTPPRAGLVYRARLDCVDVFTRRRVKPFQRTLRCCRGVQRAQVQNPWILDVSEVFGEQILSYMCALTTGACRCAILCIWRRSIRMCTWFERGRSNRRPAGHSLSRLPRCARTGTTRPIRSAPRRSNLGRRDVRAEMSCSHSLVRHARGPHFRRRAEHADAASLISPVPGQPASSHTEAALRGYPW